MRKIFYIFFIMTIPFACNSQKINSKAILNKIKKTKSIVLIDKTITGSLDLTKLPSLIIAPGQMKVQINSDLIFINCHFTDSVIAFKNLKNAQIFTQFNGNISFINCTFDKPVILRQAEFYKTFRLHNCIIKDDFIADGVQFLHPKNYLNQNTFNQKARFVSSFFLSDANFMDNKFKNQTDFTNAKFLGIANFSNSEFSNYAGFYNLYANLLMMNYVIFNDKVYLANIQINQRFEFLHPQIKEDFTFKDILINGQLKFVQPKISSNASLNVKNIKVLQEAIIDLPDSLKNKIKILKIQ